ncbi:MAG: GNAT family N-acetyltransferase [Thaumarchaeota archaeon]|nr:GNAT family N-acetyltransferase [Nitrososphaerota archaeon]
MLRIIQADSEEFVSKVRELMNEYSDAMGFRFRDFEKEIADLPGEYAPPEGRLLLALEDDKAAGCVALRKLTDDVSEMRRLYVRPEFRGKRIGRQLAITAVDQARLIGYRSIRLITLSSMKGAVALYNSLGFREIQPYRQVPSSNAIFMELRLKQNDKSS